MEKIWTVLLMALATCGAWAAPYMPDVFRRGETVLFIGDSITHGGRSGDMNHYLGHGYAAEIGMRYLGYRPDLKLEFANRGQSGDTSRGLVKRWDWDAFPYTAREAGYAGVFPGGELRRMPDVVSVLVGVNGYFYTNKNHVAVGEYEQNLRTLVAKSRAARPGVRIVLCEPFRIPADASPDFAARQAAVRTVAAELGTAFVPFQALFDALLKEEPNPKYWMWDMCHPTYAAHMRMADFWLEHVSKSEAFRPACAAATPAPRTDWAAGSYHYLMNEMSRAARGQHFDLVVFGDSITMGWIYPEADKDWPGGREVWQRHFGHLKTANFGVSGDRTEHVLWRITQAGQADGWTAKTVVLAIGGNNHGQVRPGCATNDTPVEAAAGTKAVLDALLARHPESRVVLIGLLPRPGRDGGGYAWMRGYNAELAKLAGGRVSFHDIGGRFLSAPDRQAEGLFRDTVHPLPAGYEIYAQELERALGMAGEKGR